MIEVMKVTHIFFQLDGKVSPSAPVFVWLHGFSLLLQSATQACPKDVGEPWTQLPDYLGFWDTQLLLGQAVWLIGFPNSRWLQQIQQISCRIFHSNCVFHGFSVGFFLCFPLFLCQHCQHCAAAKVNADIAAAAIARALEADEFVPWQFQRQRSR